MAAKRLSAEPGIPRRLLPHERWVALKAGPNAAVRHDNAQRRAVLHRYGDVGFALLLAASVDAFLGAAVIVSGMVALLVNGSPATWIAYLLMVLGAFGAVLALIRIAQAWNAKRTFDGQAPKS